jgi:hypothetical protein
MWGRKFLHGVEILGWFLIFVFIANRSALAKESVVTAWRSLAHNLHRRTVCIGHSLRSDSLERELD